MQVFEPEITRAMQKDVYYVKDTKGTPLPLDNLMSAVKAELPDSVDITGVTVFKDADRTYQVNLSKPARASVFVDQYTGEITGKSSRPAFFTTMFKLHRWLLDSADPKGDGLKLGKLIVGISTLLFVIVLITGFLMWLPRARKGLKRSLKISFSNGWKGFWHGLHVAGGMYALVLVLAMALTGLTWSFGWYKNAFYAVCGVEMPQNAPSKAPAPGVEKGSAPKDKKPEATQAPEFQYWQSAYDQLRAENPHSPQITVSDHSASVTLGTTGNVRAADKYKFDADGKVSLQKSYADSDASDRLRGTIYSVHTGAFGGITTRILWFLAALLGASLPLTGYYIWIKRLRARNRMETKQDNGRIGVQK